MEPLANIDELQKRWRELSDLEKGRAETLLVDASVIVMTMCKQQGVEINGEDELQTLTIQSIVCEMVKRAMLSPVDQAPATSYMQTAGAYSEQFTYSNPNGDLYLTANEKKRLGIGGKQRLFSIAPVGGVSNEG